MKANPLKKITLNTLMTVNLEEKRNLDSKSTVGEAEIEPFKLLARPRGFKPLTLGLEMRGIVVTNCIEYHTNCPKGKGHEIKDYKKKFDFPFIIAVAGRNKSEILDNFRKRIKNDKNTEFNEAVIQVKKIASLRLKQINNN